MSKYPDPLGGTILPAALDIPHQESYRKENTEIQTPSRPAPPPGEESVGPALIELVRQTKRAFELENELLRDALKSLDNRLVIEYASGSTDGSGNLDLKLFTVPMGYAFYATRINIEGGAFTPASPFSAATAWLALIRGTNFGVSSILDFGPAAASGTIIPSIFSTSRNHAPALRGGEILTLHIVGSATLANTSIWARCQGFLDPL
jgi:hypothetical protein